MPTQVPKTPVPKPAPPRAARPTPVPAARGQGRPAVPLIAQGGPPAVVLSPSTAMPGVGMSKEVAELVRSPDPGSPLPPTVKKTLEASLNVPLDPVRVHSDARTATVVNRAGSRAFTFGPHIYLGSREQPTDLTLMAHEVAHVVQQQAMPVVQHAGAGTASADVFEREAHQVAAAVTRGESATVSERTAGPRQQNLGLGDALNFFADKANLIPGFRLFTIVLGVNPINMSGVDRSAANILRGIVELMPGGGLIVIALNNHGVFEKAGAWVEEQIRSLGMTGSSIKQAVDSFLKSLSWSDIFDLGGVWNRAKQIFTDPIDRLLSFGKGLVTGIITLIKDAILMPLAKLAEGTRGWDLLTAILGKNPITGEAVPRNAETLIGGFMKLIGQEEVWENMKKANTVGKAWAWFQTAMATLMGFVSQIPTLAINAFKSLEIADIILLPRALMKVAAVFGNFIGDFISWAGEAVWNLLEIIFSAVAPNLLTYIKKTGAALKSIFKNPLPFMGNLIKAGMLGFKNFGSNLGTHLKAGLIDWLTGSLPGIYIPKGFTLGEIAKFAFSVLGLSWANIRQKLVKVVGEPAVAVMETGFKIVVTLVKDGPAAAWEQIKEQLANLKDMVIGGITSFVIDMVVQKAIPRVIAMFIPGAGFLSAIMSIYDTIMVFVNQISKIARVVTGFIDSIVAIASGAIGAAAAKVENSLAGILSLAINFLAGFAGLGKVSSKIMEVIAKVRAPIDKALDWLIGWIVTTAKKLFARAFNKDKNDDRTEEKKDQDKRAAIGEAEKLLSGKAFFEDSVRGKLGPIKGRYKLLTLDLVVDAKKEKTETVHFTASASTVVVGLPTAVPVISELNLVILSKPFKARNKVADGRKLAMNRQEVKDQVEMQEFALNQLTVKVWRNNLDKYYPPKVAVGAVQPQGGRHGQAEAKRDLEAARTAEMVRLRAKWKANNPGKLKTDEDQFIDKMNKRSGDRAFPFVNPYVISNNVRYDSPVYGKQILHAVDQSAGGGTETVGLGGARENTSIGAQWEQGGLSALLRTEVEAEIKATQGKLPAKEKSKVESMKLKVKLNTVDA